MFPSSREGGVDRCVRTSWGSAEQGAGEYGSELGAPWAVGRSSAQPVSVSGLDPAGVRLGPRNI
jgi:hypothetical protein